MPIETITFKNKEYPKFQSVGGASLWVREFAKQYCIGNGIDIGYSKTEWMYPGALGWDVKDNPERHAMNLPNHTKYIDGSTGWDYIHSSHCLEHVNENWHNVLDYWLTKIKVGGIIFLYLPHKSQEYWLPENNRKHIHSFTGKEIADYLRSLGHKVIRSGVDLNNSFVVVCEKADKIGTYITPNGLEKPNDAPDRFGDPRFYKASDIVGMINNILSENENRIDGKMYKACEKTDDGIRIFYNNAENVRFFTDADTFNKVADAVKKKLSQKETDQIIPGYFDNFMYGCFDKSIDKMFNESDFTLKSHTSHWPDNNITDFTNKIKEDRLKRESNNSGIQFRK